MNTKLIAKTVVLVITLIVIESLTAGIAGAIPPHQGAGGQVYVVLKDDWLSKIAMKYYGDMFAYPLIVEATNAKAAEDDHFAVIQNPDIIEIGQKLWIPDTASMVVASSKLTPDSLRNAAYQGIYEQPVQLTDGKYTGEPFVAGGASRPTVTLIDQFNAWGDLNGDDIQDAVVILAENSGGSGVFIYLAAVINQAGKPVNSATQFLGDRVDLKSLSIDQGEILLTLLTQGPNDPMCCPSQEVIMRYRLVSDQLVQQVNFAGTYKAMLPAASSPGRDITLTLKAGGSVELSTDYLNGEASLVEIGIWVDNNDGTATVTLTGRPEGRVYDKPDVIIFKRVNNELTAVVYDLAMYGSEGLRLTKQ